MATSTPTSRATPSDRARLPLLRDGLRGVRALILDADGVLLYAGQPLPGAAEALGRLDDSGTPYRVVTNFSLAHRESLAAGVSRQFGRLVRAETIITAASAAAGHTARHHAGQPLFILASDDARREWDGQWVLTPDEADAANPGDGSVAAVVIGDAGDDLSFRNLDIAFRHIRAGAAFVAMHRNPWWVTPRGATLDSGALVIGLEHALERKATIAGKPSPVVYREAVRELAAEVAAAGGRSLKRGEVAMVGDDLQADVAGARRAGLRGILVLTGKTDRVAVAATAAAGRLRGPVRPDGVGANVGEVVDALLGAPGEAR